MKKTILFLVALMGLLCYSWAQESKKPVVILISLDGFRYDYVERFQPENLSRFIAEGTAAKSLIPSFPTKTFPNHYTIATGLRPEHHGIVDNGFYDPNRDEEYHHNNPTYSTDGSWYGGTPLWVLAEQNGMKAASYFFVGSEADVQGLRPSYYFNYDGRVDNLTRVSQVFEWLQLPEEEMPQMISMYFSDMDDVGHAYGPLNDQKLNERLQQLDHTLGTLMEGVKSLDLDVNIFIVSDHGMMEVPFKNFFALDEITEGLDLKVVNNGALAHLYLDNPKKKKRVLKKLNKREGPFKVVDVEESEYYQDLSRYGDRIGDILILPELGFYIASNQEGLARVKANMARAESDYYGGHGFSPTYQQMHGIFYANGPEIKEGMTIESFENIHIYPLICQILGLPIPEGIDGELQVLAPILKD